MVVGEIKKKSRTREESRRIREGLGIRLTGGDWVMFDLLKINEQVEMHQTRSER